MIKITIPAASAWNDQLQQFVDFKGQELCLEHSLVSISKWEAKWHKPFIGNDKKTSEEIIDYIKCMTTNQNVDPNSYSFLSNDNLKAVNKYIEDSMTATTFSDRKGPGSGKYRKPEIITSEVIYYWMIACQIPFECQKWHLNRLLTLIRVCNIKNDTGANSKMSKGEILSRNRALNEARKKQFNTKG